MVGVVTGELVILGVPGFETGEAELPGVVGLPPLVELADVLVGSTGIFGSSAPKMG
jgi:hypothetical protein